MQLLRKVWSFGSTIEEMVGLWKTYCLSVLDQSCVLWNSGLTMENKRDLERTQKTFAKLVLQEKYKTYNEALLHFGLKNLELRRKELSLDFAKRSLADGHFGDLLKKRKSWSYENKKKKLLWSNPCQHRKVQKFANYHHAEVT